MPLIRKPPPGNTDSTAPANPAGPCLDALVGGDDNARWNAARAAPDTPEGARALGEALGRERNPRVREAILTSLVRMSTPEGVQAVLPLLRSDDALLRTGALDALRTMGGAVRPYLPPLLHDADADVRLIACELLRQLPGEQATPLLCAILDTETEPNVCASAVEVLAEVGGPEALPVLARCEERFRGIAFLEFSIRTTIDQIRSQVSR